MTVPQQVQIESWADDVEQNIRGHRGQPHPELRSRKNAQPSTLGLFGFATTTLVLGLFLCGAGVPNSTPENPFAPDNSIFGLAIFMGGLVQIIVGVMEFSIGNTFGMTTHSSFGAFWLSYAMFLVPSLNIKGGYAGDARAYTLSIGIYLITWCFVTFIFLVAAIKTNYVSIGLYFFLLLSLLCSSISNFIITTHPVASGCMNKAGGAFSVTCAMLAFYLASSGLITRERTNIHLPLGDIAK